MILWNFGANFLTSWQRFLRDLCLANLYEQRHEAIFFWEIQWSGYLASKGRFHFRDKGSRSKWMVRIWLAVDGFLWKTINPGSTKFRFHQFFSDLIGGAGGSPPVGLAQQRPGHTLVVGVLPNKCFLLWLAVHVYSMIWYDRMMMYMVISYYKM